MKLARFLSTALLLFAVACGTLEDGRGWGEDVTLLPGWKRIGKAARDAALDPLTWAPLAGAAVLKIDDWDERISDWAREETPVFGSQERAKRAQNWTGDAADAVFLASALATPSGPEPAPWIFNKVKGLAVGLSARYLTVVSVDVLKDAVGRTRPNEENDKSFPSEHASTVAVSSTLASRNLRSIEMPSALHTSLNASLGVLTAAGAWCRVESGNHFPADVLAGISIGHFLGAFINDAFLGLGEHKNLDVIPTDDGVVLSLAFRF